MDRLIIPGQTRQMRRDAARTGATTADLQQLASTFITALDNCHYRINVMYEAMRLMGLTDEMFKEAQANVDARRESQ